MTKVFIEPRPKGRPEGAEIEDFVVEEEGDRVLKTFKTQEEAITWVVEEEGHSPNVARVRHQEEHSRPLAAGLAGSRGRRNSQFAPLPAHKPGCCGVSLRHEPAPSAGRASFPCPAVAHDKAAIGSRMDA
jgi:hypothetical protein